MKLKKIREVLVQAIPQLNYEAHPVTIAGNQYTQLSSLSSLKNAIILLSRNNLFQAPTDFLSNSYLFQHTGEPIHISIPEGRDLALKINSIKDAATELLSILDTIVSEEKENVVYIRIPQVNDLQGLSAVSATLNKIFSQVLLDEEIGGTVKLESVENGSIWIEIFVGPGKALALVASLTYAAAFIYKEFQKGLMIAETRRTRKLANDKIEMLMKAQQVLLDDLIDSEAHGIENQFFSKSDPERILRIKNSIAMMSDEMKKGLELIPSGKTSDEVAKLFPNMKQLMTLMSPIKGIAASSKDEEGS